MSIFCEVKVESVVVDETVPTFMSTALYRRCIEYQIMKVRQHAILL
jgi:hypothetical protein